MLRMLVAVPLTTLMLCHDGWSQTYPSRPVRIVVGFGSGGPDASARILAQALAAQTGQPYVVDNRPGASGMIGADVVAKAPPDGHTLLVASGTFALFPSIYKKVPFDVIRDFAPVTQIGSSDAFILVAAPSLQAHSVKELLALARIPGSRITYGSNGVGSIGHLAGAAFAAAAKISMLHVPYKSAAATLNAVLGGEVHVMFATPALSVPLVAAGKLRGLAYDYPTRAPSLPDVPTMAEAGGPVTGIQPGGHLMFAPAKTPAPTLAVIEALARKVITSPDVGERLRAIGLTPVGSSSEQFRQYYFSLVKRFTAAARAAGVEPE